MCRVAIGSTCETKFSDRSFSSVRRLEVTECDLKFLGWAAQRAPASRAGLRAGDIIVKYNGESLSPSNARRQLWQLIMETKVGSQVPLVVVRDGHWSTVEVTIGKCPPEPRRRR